MKNVEKQEKQQKVSINGRKPKVYRNRRKSKVFRKSIRPKTHIGLGG